MTNLIICHLVRAVVRNESPLLLATRNETEPTSGINKGNSHGRYLIIVECPVPDVDFTFALFGVLHARESTRANRNYGGWLISRGYNRESRARGERSRFHWHEPNDSRHMFTNS